MLTTVSPSPFCATRLNRPLPLSAYPPYDPERARAARAECGVAAPRDQWQVQFAHLHRHHLRLEDRIEDVKKRSDIHAGVVWAMIALVLGLQLFSIAAMI